MNQHEIYKSIFNNHISNIQNNNVAIDELLSGIQVDKRRGISLIIPCENLYNSYKYMIKEFRRMCPEQYFYPKEDVHITVFSYIPGSTEYKTSQFQDEKYSSISELILENEKPFTITFKGMVFSDSAGLITGFDNFNLVKLIILK